MALHHLFRKKSKGTNASVDRYYQEGESVEVSTTAPASSASEAENDNPSWENILAQFNDFEKRVNLGRVKLTTVNELNEV